MLRKIEKVYIETYSVWEKYRLRIIHMMIGGVIVSLITAIYSLVLGYVILFLIIILLIAFGGYARKKDYNDIKKQSNKNKIEFKYNDYKRIKFNELKYKISKLLKKNNMYNKDSLEVIINCFERKITKYDKVSIISLIISVFLALFGLKLQELAIVIVVVVIVAICLIIPLAIELTLQYILVNKVKYEELVNALVEIELEIINTKHRKKKVDVKK